MKMLHFVAITLKGLQKIFALSKIKKKTEPEGAKLSDYLKKNLAKIRYQDKNQK